MNYSAHNRFYQFKQQGAALIISLIILGIMTIIGVTNIRHSGLELKVVSGAHERSAAFEAAEYALTIIEQQLTESPFNEHRHYSDCAGEECFNPQCQNGLCFAGAFHPSSNFEHCEVANTQNPRLVDFWRDSELNVWQHTDHHRTLTVNGIEQPVKYIIEFLCFNKIGSEINGGGSTNQNLAPLYRITALATGNTGRSEVMLQSTYRVITSGGDEKALATHSLNLIDSSATGNSVAEADNAVHRNDEAGQLTLKSRRLAWREVVNNRN